MVYEGIENLDGERWKADYNYPKRLSHEMYLFAALRKLQ